MYRWGWLAQVGPQGLERVSTGVNIDSGTLTSKGELDQQSKSKNHKRNIQQEVLVIIDSNAIVYPRAVAAKSQWNSERHGEMS